MQVFNRIDNRSMTDELDAKMRDSEHYPLRLVTAELATQTLVVLPRDAYLFYTVSSHLHASGRLPQFSRCTCNIVRAKAATFAADTYEITYGISCPAKHMRCSGLTAAVALL